MSARAARVHGEHCDIAGCSRSAAQKAGHARLQAATDTLAAAVPRSVRWNKLHRGYAAGTWAQHSFSECSAENEHYITMRHIWCTLG